MAAGAWSVWMICLVMGDSSMDSRFYVGRAQARHRAQPDRHRIDRNRQPGRTGTIADTGDTVAGLGPPYLIAGERRARR